MGQTETADDLSSRYDRLLSQWKAADGRRRAAASKFQQGYGSRNPSTIQEIKEALADMKRLEDVAPLLLEPGELEAFRDVVERAYGTLVAGMPFVRKVSQ